MRKGPVQLWGGVAALAAGTAGLWGVSPALERHAAWLLVGGALLVLFGMVRATFRPKGQPWPEGSADPRPLRFGWRDFLKAGIATIDAFNHTYAVEPGLYYLGDRYDPSTPLLVTANYHLTVLLVARRARRHRARLLVIDTDGINVWCSAGKGRFSNEAIMAQVARYPRALLTDKKWLELILPKLSFSGVNLRALRKEKIKPVVGPIYAKDLPEFLSADRRSDRADDHVHFGLASRAFTLVPGLTQFLGYAFALFSALVLVEQLADIPAPSGLFALVLVIATAYPLAFPYLPGRRFSVKGLWLAAFVGAALLALHGVGALDRTQLFLALPFEAATALFYGLSYTGNSAVSNYTRVRKETARFLPIDAALFLASAVVFVWVGVVS